MRLPASYIAAGPANATDISALHNDGIWMFSKKGGYDENWSSLIGIITAIVGNVLISFALNMQRYAHIRLDREWQEKERQRKKRSASGTSLSRLADEERSQNDGKKNFHLPRKSGHGNGQQRDSVEANESDPLIPQSPSRSPDRPSRQSEDSGSSGQEEAYKQKSYLKSPYWWAGIILMTVGEAGNFLAYGFAPASIVSPLGVVALISNCIIAPFMLKEPFRKRDVLGVVIAVGGAVTVALSANDNNPKLGPGEIWKLINTWEFETYLGVTVGVIVLLMVASNRYGEKNILIDLGLVGLLGGYTALSTKGVASLLSYTLWHVITFPVFYLLVAILIGTAVMQIKYVNRALQRFDATQVIPVQFVLFTLSVILGSAVLYRDFERTSGDDAGKFVGGCAMTFLGVWFITTGRPRRQDDDEDREPEPEDAINLVGESYRDSIDESHPNEARTRRSSTTRTSSPPRTTTSRSNDPRPWTPSMNLMSETSSRAQQDFFSTPDVFSNQLASDRNIPRPGQFERHTSTPILPSEAAPPPGTMTSASDPDLPPPRTPTRGRSHMDYPTTPTTTPQPRRLRTNERIHRAGSGPLLASPLSTTLSAMVQDLKRTGSMRNDTRRSSVLGIEAELAAGPTALDTRRTNDDGATSAREWATLGSESEAYGEHGMRPREGV
ncbi:magnesium transporter NIPA-domain-containing protein [Ampelomyces quisqualis]|uniref:Magnesium transporter NIPA-domain-containing protein n=1 Tax=Ampelomyces quisqualis TaxID=50730 RepID=A0A6A5QJ60_AMPQU|nr:magnesium transporter NIPA-domain-containing protein [Ampelomyces quisqualis]